MSDDEDAVMLRDFLLRQDARFESLHAELSARDALLARALKVVRLLSGDEDVRSLVADIEKALGRKDP